jgi:uncharacterized protein (TIGR02118 family)
MLLFNLTVPGFVLESGHRALQETIMFKAMILLKRNDSLSFEEFKTHWLTGHAELVCQLPGLRKAVFNFNQLNGEGGFDGVSELWFDTEQDFVDAYASETGKKVADDALCRVSRRERLFLEEHDIL